MRLRSVRSGRGTKSLVGGPSGPMLFGPIAATGNKSIGPEGPPTKDFAAPS
ncbi:DUF6053 domain-containing protein [Lysobacter sp. TAB13]|uniref:DUF6053 domain-containing protein n=1 Tax=Lysobacter sp. TAB13 TaxID=3233065 RepID=UPI003F9640B8